MVHKTELTVRGCIASKHIVQLFDDAASRANSVSRFVLEGLSAGDAVLVVARTKHWNAIANRMEKAGATIAGAAHSGNLMVCDAAQTLSQFMRDGQPVPRRFEAVVGRIVAQLSRRPRRKLRIYGEMVDLLAEEREFAAAHALENLWSELGLRRSFTLLCGYSSAHFTDPATAAVLSSICDTHSHVRVGTEDLLGNWVLRRLVDVQPRARIA